MKNLISLQIKKQTLIEKIKTDYFFQKELMTKWF